MSTFNSPQSDCLNNVESQEVQQFKSPINPVARKKIKPKILTEEKYIEEMAKIIQRDFFPDLEKLRAQNEYLDAMERKDFVQMEALRAKYSSGRTPVSRDRRNTPSTFETPLSMASQTPRDVRNDYNTTTKSNESSETSGNTVEKVSEYKSLDSFLQCCTSEDNHSFQEIVDAADKKLKQKFSILYGEERNSAEKLAKALTLPSIEKQFEEQRNNDMQRIETWSYTNKNSIMYIPDGVELTDDERIDMANRKQSIQHSATRLNCNPFDESRSQRRITEMAKHQLQNYSEKVGPDGHIANSSTSQTENCRGFDLVRTPSPRPGEAFSPLMTWGEIEGTPFRLDGSDTPIRSNAGPSFKINETSRRENIAIALAEQIGEKMRAQKQKAMDAARRNIGSPFIRSNIERLASMSPAARQLATTKLGLRTPLAPTPSPIRTRVTGIKCSPSVTAARKSLKLLNPFTANNNKEVLSEKATLTDDLLQIPTKRSRAADFF